MQVGGDDGVERLRLHHHPHGHRIDQHLVPGHVLELGRDLGGDLVPHHHGMALRVALGHDRQQLARPGLGQLEGVANDALHSSPRHHGDVLCDLDRQSLVHAAADTGVLALRVLAHDHPVQLRAGDMAKWADDAGQDPGRAYVGVLVERLADSQA